MTAAAAVEAPVRAAVFDFDGVILDSADLKGEALAAMFADHPEHLPAILAHHEQHLGISRFEKFRWVYRELLRRPLPADAERRLGERYSAWVVGRVLASPFVPGALELLRELAGRLVFVASGTPQEELERIVRERGVEDCFTEVHGSPPGKEEILRGILDRHRLAPGEVLMVGDGLSDYRAAAATGVRFAGRAADDRFAGLGVPVIDDLRELRPLLGLGGGGRDEAMRA